MTQLLYRPVTQGETAAIAAGRAFGAENFKNATEKKGEIFYRT